LCGKGIRDAGNPETADTILVYAWLQEAQDDRAPEILAEMRAMTEVEHPDFAAAYAFAAVPVRYPLERHDWKAATSLEVLPSWFRWQDFPHDEAIPNFGRALRLRTDGRPDRRTAGRRQAR
jgi:hypothetical protein